MVLIRQVQGPLQAQCRVKGRSKGGGWHTISNKYKGTRVGVSNTHNEVLGKVRTKRPLPGDGAGGGVGKAAKRRNHPAPATSRARYTMTMFHPRYDEHLNHMFHPYAAKNAHMLFYAFLKCYAGVYAKQDIHGDVYTYHSMLLP